MSLGFHRHAAFELVAAVDAQIGKPSAGRGRLECNQSYAANIGMEPFERDLRELDGAGLRELVRPRLGVRPVAVLSACAPCTGFSRANPNNHLDDDPRNNLVRRIALWAEALEPAIIVMENARELLRGNFTHHSAALIADLARLGYRVEASVHRLDRLGLPQIRERALLVAVRRELPDRRFEQLWRPLRVDPEAVTVRRAIAHLPPIAHGETHPRDPMHVSPRLAREQSRRRMAAIPKDGGSWLDLREHPAGEALMTPAMRRIVASGKLGSHPDVYGRLAWDKPAVTIKRECAHVGNGRYAHPEQDRLLTVREMALLQGFPADVTFRSGSLANLYRHIGDAVPPLIAFQLAGLCAWILGGSRPKPAELVLPGTSLRPSDLSSTEAPRRVAEPASAR